MSDKAAGFVNRAHIDKTPPSADDVVKLLTQIAELKGAAPR